MNFLDALRISSGGLSAQRLRMNLIAGNLANQNTTRTEGGGPYRRKEAVFEARPFQETLDPLLAEPGQTPVSRVRVSGIVEDSRPPVLRYEPGHPDADPQGYVAYPNINVIEEMVNMMSAARSYEANVTAITTAKEMALKALEIGK